MPFIDAATLTENKYDAVLSEDVFTMFEGLIIVLQVLCTLTDAIYGEHVEGGEQFAVKTICKGIASCQRINRPFKNRGQNNSV